mgnify:CR=1 FL=1
MIATVTTDARGSLTDDSTLTIGDATVPVPARTDTLGRLAPARIVAAITGLGYRITPDSIAVYDGYVTYDVTAA